jgi:CRP-like cAMP-binding protein
MPPEAHIGSLEPIEGEAEMLSLVEKVIVLKSASLFSQTPGNVLADIAQLVQEISFDSGALVFNKGDFGDSLYIIVSGKVQVWDGKRLLNELGKGDIFGELALLDPAPRSASVRTIEPTHLLQLDETHFRTILAERPELPTAIIRVLTGYIRDHFRLAENMNTDRNGSGSLGPPADASGS